MAVDQSCEPSCDQATEDPPIQWADIVKHSPVPMLLVEPSRNDSNPDLDRSVPKGLIRFANTAAQNLFSANQQLGGRSLYELVDPSVHSVLNHGLNRCAVAEPGGGTDQEADVIVLASDAEVRERLGIYFQPLGSSGIAVQIVQGDGWRAVDRVVKEQQKFRSALLELSELAYVARNDDEFYQRLLERAVEVVPGAQGGSVQLNIAETTEFRFVAAVGYDLAGLQEKTLNQEHFFRDALDPVAQIVRDFGNEWRSSDTADWLETVGRLSEIVVNVSAPVLVHGQPVAFLSLDNFEDADAINATSVEMTTVLSRLIGELWRRRMLEATVRKEREAFRHQAFHDPLTGLANRRNLERTLDEKRPAVRADQPAAVLFVDLDDFKGVNDRLGHAMGDQLLTAVAAGLRAVVRPGDTVGRWGGDEFLIIPDQLASFNDAAALVDRILKHFDSQLDLGNGVAFRARLTVGVGWCPDSNVDRNELVRAADAALYEAKASGKGIARYEQISI